MSQFNSEKYMMYHGLSDKRRIEKDTLCANCGYNLKGLMYGTICPECGTPMLLPRRGGEFVHAPPDYLERMSRGLLCIIVAWLCLIGGLVGTFFLGFFVPITHELRQVMLVVGVLLTAAGCHLLDARRPNEARPQRFWLDVSRLAFIFSLVTATAVGLTAYSAYQASPSNSAASTLSLGKLGIVMEVLSILSLIVTQACVTFWLRVVATEAQDARLAEALTHQWWGFVILGILTFLFTIVTTWVRVTRGGMIPVPCLGGYFPVLFLILIEFWWAWTVVRLRSMCGWAIRYQEFDAGRAERDRERGMSI